MPPGLLVSFLPLTLGDSFLFFNIYLFIWLHLVLVGALGIFVAACRIFSCSMWALSCSMQDLVL